MSEIDQTRSVSDLDRAADLDIRSLPETLEIPLDDKQSMEFVLIQPGEFTMGLTRQEHPALPEWFGRCCFFAGLIAFVVLFLLFIRRWKKTGRCRFRLTDVVILVSASCAFVGGMRIIREAGIDHRYDATYRTALEFQGRENVSTTPPRLVRISRPYYVAKYEVTYAQFLALVDDVQIANSRGEHSPDKPVVELTFDEAYGFCRALSDASGYRCRLPTEEEWEYACRAGTTSYFHAGNDSDDLSRVAWWEFDMRPKEAGTTGGWTSYSFGPMKPRPPGLKEPNAWGLYDMHGNAREWCSWSEQDRARRGDDPYPGLHVARGGSWGEGMIQCMSSYRAVFPKDWIDWSSGFRPVIEAGSVQQAEP